MKKQGVPEVKDFMGMNIINSLMYHKEAIKRETNEEKIEFHKRRLEELKLELGNHKAA